MKYIRQQINSLLDQEIEGDIEILVRDDGSVDGTPDYLDSLNDSRLIISRGKNIGPRRSYFELLRMARESTANFYALCDQDDIWHRDKISSAVSRLNEDRPAIYCSSLNLVDANLQPIGKFLHAGNRSFKSSLLSNFNTGCTCVLNRSFLDWMPFPEDSDKVIMHDWWIATVATIGARIEYDVQSHISYRQHGSNHVGIDTRKLALLSKARRVLLNKEPINNFDQAEQIWAAIEQSLSLADRNMLSDFLSGRESMVNRVKFVLKHGSGIRLRSKVRFLLI